MNTHAFLLAVKVVAWIALAWGILGFGISLHHDITYPGSKLELWDKVRGYTRTAKYGRSILLVVVSIFALAATCGR